LSHKHGKAHYTLLNKDDTGIQEHVVGEEIHVNEDLSIQNKKKDMHPSEESKTFQEQTNKEPDALHETAAITPEVSIIRETTEPEPTVIQRTVEEL
jgi:hypothetical protein